MWRAVSLDIQYPKTMGRPWEEQCGPAKPASMLPVVRPDLDRWRTIFKTLIRLIENFHFTQMGGTATVISSRFRTHHLFRNGSSRRNDGGAPLGLGAFGDWPSLSD
jgi:hypothetical protein